MNPGATDADAVAVERYLALGLALGRHLDGLVDAYYGPPDLAARAAAGAPQPLPALAADARRLVADLDAGVPGLSDARRRWVRAQVLGLHTVARKLAGEDIDYRDEVEACYGVRPDAVPEDAIAEAHRSLDEALPGRGPVRDRYVNWRRSQEVPGHLLEPAVRSLAEDLRERTGRTFGLPEGEHVDWVFETGKPWAGFNYYLGDLRSRVAINVDLPVFSTVLGHLVAHEAYPGHHTEHCRKEVGIVRRRRHLEETIFLVGTPQCLLAEGLADLALEALVGEHPEPLLAEHLRPLGIPYDADVAARVASAAATLGAVRGNLALRLHVDGADPEVVVGEAERWLLLPRERAEKQVRFLTDPTWRAYIFCYVEGVELCRRFVAGDAARFEQLITEPLLPADLAAAA
ncbi:MAG: DUF885 domain-containing protein [Actinobacteria bacterium]|nr:DUF885 domain-containing protein [Actinomycetota bacterium]